MFSSNMTMDVTKAGTSYLSVPEFYAGKTVFITGGTGFLGKVLIEKLLYSGGNIDKIYVLLREKNGNEAKERLKRLINSPVFSRLREEKPESLSKIKHIVGDISVNNLGLTSSHEVLLKKVSVVFHLAATVRFDEPLKNALNINLEGTREVLKAFKDKANLDAFVYVSTAFSNTDKQEIDECIYPPPRTLEEVYKRIKEEDSDEDLSEFLNGRPNTYTFTKALAENVLAQEHGNVPSVIVRPSIVTPAADEPFKGWIDNWMGITTFLYTVAKGWTRVLYGKRSYVLDIIPVDYVVNLTIIAAARCKRSNDVPVFNICSSSANPISSGLLGNLLMEESAKQKFYDFPLFGLVYIKSAVLVTIVSFLLETLPAYLADFWLRITCRSKSSISFVKVQKKQSRMRENMRYFQSRSWKIKSNRTTDLYASLTLQDRKTFPCEAADLRWSQYIPTYFNGIKKYLVDSRKQK
ncbi:PREDICTED: fatty acyl-CoA reductase 1-like [Papilio polytes]|uniref:fatty acyl-CoA reductase 1-like n=1 Tax=Papilio polytes TaxID=76194 RepID=UPI0006760E8A|nr:PREDICTED: fatty acyl-CoA reductase 1-like [Papilio polytes]